MLPKSPHIPGEGFHYDSLQGSFPCVQKRLCRLRASEWMFDGFSVILPCGSRPCWAEYCTGYGKAICSAAEPSAFREEWVKVRFSPGTPRVVHQAHVYLLHPRSSLLARDGGVADRHTPRVMEQSQKRRRRK